VNRFVAVRTDVPVDPDAATAQRWARDELADPIYHHGTSLLQRLLNWILEQLHGISTVGFSMNGGGLILVAILLVLVIAAFVVAGPVRRRRTLRNGSAGVVLGDDTRTADQLRADADAAAARGAWAAAVADRFRALVRGLEERTVLDERPGRTADEAVRSAGQRLPALADDLERGAVLFDDVVYGARAADAQDEARMRALESTVRAARPVDLAAASR
jgi:hypothetical protein